MVIGISGSESVGSPWSFARMRCLPVMPQYHHRLTKLGNVINRPVMERECRSSSDLRNCGCDECGLTDGGGKRVEQHICDGSRHASAHLTFRRIRRYLLETQRTTDHLANHAYLFLLGQRLRPG